MTTNQQHSEDAAQISDQQKDEWVAELQSEFGEDSFTSGEACEVLDISWLAFMEAFVCLRQHSGRVQKTGRRGNESVYSVIEG